ncbi:MAG: hypothetical protein U9Q83_10055 [Bacteroidota bacterium]|nr:hypothetical protein [Bacteroidota bacterium]
MLTTIQEQVTVGKNGLIQLHAPGFKYNSILSVVAVLEVQKEEVEEINKKENFTSSQNSKSTTALGILSKYAKPALQHLEKNAFSRVMGEKYATG